MKSISARLTLWYAMTATSTLACLFVAGYYLLESRLISGLDLLNAAEIRQIQARLGTDYTSLTPEVIDKRIRETTEYASVLFYIEIDSPKLGILFRSTNMNGQAMPDVKGQHVFNVEVDGIGELRVGEFIMQPFDISIGTPLGQVREVMRRYIQVCVALIVAMMLISIVIGFGLSQLVLRPVRLIRETANRIRFDNLSERIPVGEVKDEISDLAKLLNQMFDRLESSFNQIRRFTADASHELRTPLSLIRLHAERMLVSGKLSPVEEEAVHVQLEEITRLNMIIDDLLFLSRADARVVKMNLQAEDANEFLKSFLPDAMVLVEHHGRRFEHTHEGHDKATFDAKWIRQVLLNLLTNAINASPSGGLIALRSEIKNGLWCLRVENEGPSLSDEQCQNIFERFVRLDQDVNNHKGSGLGLAICRSIVELHRGKIYAVSSIHGNGLSVVVEIPI